jgi:hypothetical protein
MIRVEFVEMEKENSSSRQKNYSTGKESPPHKEICFPKEQKQKVI